MIKKFISTILSVSICLSVFSMMSFAKDNNQNSPVNSVNTVTRRGIILNTKWDNYTVADLGVKFDENTKINGTAIKDLAMFKTTIILSDYFTIQNSKSKNISINGATEKNSKIMLSTLPDVKLNSVPVIKSINIQYKKDAASETQTKTLSNVNLKLCTVKGYESDVTFNNNSNDTATVFMSVSNNLKIDDNESIENYSEIKFICEPSEYFASTVYKDANNTIKDFAGLSMDQNNNVIWTYVPYKTSNKYSPAGNGVFFKTKKIANGAFLNGQLPVFKKITVIGTKQDGTTVSKEVNSPYVKIKDYKVEPYVKMNKNLAVYFNRFGVYTINKNEKVYIDYEKDMNPSFSFDENNFDANTCKLLPTYKIDSNGKLHVGDWKFKVYYLDGTSNICTVPVYIKKPMVKVTVIDGNTKTKNKVAPYSQYSLPQAKGMDGKEFDKWVYAGTDNEATTSVIVDRNMSLKAVYKDKAGNPVIDNGNTTDPSDDEDIDIDITQDDTPQSNGNDINGNLNSNKQDSVEIDLSDDMTPTSSNPKTASSTVVPFIIITMLGAIATSCVVLKKKAK